MNRDEILARSRRENQPEDEREKTIRIRRDAFSLGGVVVLGFFFMMLKISTRRTSSPFLPAKAG